MSYDNVPILPPHRAIRHRPALFIGATDAYGLHGVLDDAICACLESVRRGFSHRIDLTLHPDGAVELGCDGPGFLTGDERLGKAGLAHAFSGSPHTTGMPAAWGPARLGGWFCGLLALGTLGTYLEAMSRREEVTERVRLERGNPVLPQPLAPISEEYGTYLRWLPDPEIFNSITWELERLDLRLQTLACLVPGVEIRLVDLRSGERRRYHHPDGMADLVAVYGAAGTVLHVPVRLEHHGEWGEVSIGLQYHRAAAGYCPEPRNAVVGFANCRNTRDGVHLSAFQAALVQVVNRVATEDGTLPPGTVGLGWREVRAGLRAVISVGLDTPYWTGSTRSRLDNRELREPLTQAITTELNRSLAEAPDVWRKMVQQVVDVAR